MTDDNKRFSPERSAELREAYFNGVMMEYMRQLFTAKPQLQCVGLAVAQYWDDEANDAVHLRKYPCEHAELDLPAFYAWQERNYDGLNMEDVHPHMPNEADLDLWSWEREHFGEDWYRDPINNSWNDNHDAVSLFGGFVEEEGDQNSDESENYSLFCIYRKDTHGNLVWEYTTELRRPYVDGCWPEWALAEDGSTEDPDDGPMIRTIERFRALESTMDAATKGASVGHEAPRTQGQT